MEKTEENERNQEEKKVLSDPLVKRLVTAAILAAVGLVLSFLMPFAYFYIFGTKINPVAHLINTLTGVLIGLAFSVVTASIIAVLRFSFAIGTIHAFHGGISGAFVVGIVAYILRKKKPKYVEFAALAEPIGTVFIGGTIAEIVVPFYTVFSVGGMLIYWWLFFWSSLVGSILGFITLLILKKAGISWKDFY